jgi:hypothetical protein
MVNWNYDNKAYDDGQFETVPIGEHRVRIDEVLEKISKSSGNPMLEIKLSVSGCSGKLWYYLVFNQTEPDKTNRALGSIFDSFGIRQGDMNLSNWAGKVGGAKVKHETFDGENKPKIAYFLSSEKVRKLPPWQGSEPDIDLPFDV